MTGFLERLLIGLALVSALVFGAYLYGCDTTREKIVNAQLRQDIKVIQWQRKGTVRTIIKYVKIKEKHDANMPALARDIVRRCLLSSGVALQPGAAVEGVPEDGARAVGPDQAAADEAHRAWCEQLAADYAAGVHNWDAAEFYRGWIQANGGGPE